MKDFVKRLKTVCINFSSTFLARILILAILLIVIVAIIFAGKRSYKVELHEGDISLNDIYAPYNFTYPTEIDEAKTKELREKALSGSLPVYDIQPGYWEDKRKFLLNFFKELANVKEIKDVSDNVRIEKLKTNINLEIDNKLVFPFLREDLSGLEETAISVLNMLSPKMIADKSTIEELTADKKGEIILRNKTLGVEGKIPYSDLYTKEQLRPIIEKELKANGIEQRELQSAYTNLLLSILEPNFAYNKAETETRRKTIIENVATVYNQVLVKKNELIIGKGQKVTKINLLRLDQLSKKETGHLKITYSGGIILLGGILIVILGVYLNIFRKKIFVEAKNLYLISIVIIFTLVLAKIVTNSPFSSYFIPVAAAAMLLTILLDVGVSFVLSILLSIFVAIIAGNKFNIMLASLIGSAAGIYFIRGVRRRSEILKAGFLLGVSKFAVICGIGLINGLTPVIFLKEGSWGIGSGIIAAGIVMVFLPVFEFLFKITTDLTLLELSDLNRPLLKKMVLSAPGTYHHSLIVGNLAEAASDAIGANSLLARVGAYYHDIGKIEKPEYFSENETGRTSPHEKLTPSMSALIITSHVKDGVEVAKKFNLNRTIIDFIAQHHGTSLIYYFYQRALEKIGDEEKLKEEAFRYPGPKPQSKEAAIVLLADSVEASSRALSDPTPSRIRGLVQKMINNKFIDNQLDECDLTLKDLNKISAAFVRILTGIFHTRVEYPANDKLKNKTKSKKQ